MSEPTDNRPEPAVRALEYADRLLALYRPKPNAHGVATPDHPTRKAGTYARPLTREMVADHLLGGKRYGYVPRHDDGTCAVGEIDVDLHDAQCTAEECDAQAALLEAKIKRLNLRLSLSRSRRGGAHLALFASKPVSAAAMNACLDRMLEPLGLPPQTEVYPHRPSGDGDDVTDGTSIGGWLYLPHFGALKDAASAAAFDDWLRSVDHVLAMDIETPAPAKEKRTRKNYTLPGEPGTRFNKLNSAAALIVRTNRDKSFEDQLDLLKGENSRLDPPFTPAEFREFKFDSFLKKLRRKQEAEPKPAADLSRDEVIVETAEEILATQRTAKDELGQVHLYNKVRGAYEFDRHEAFDRILCAKFLARKKPFAISDFDTKKLVKRLNLESPSFWTERPKTKINLANGILDIETGALEDHTPDFLTPSQFDHLVWDPTATCPNFDRVLSEILSPEEAAFIFEVIGYSFVPDSRYQACFLFQGKGSNGKGVILRLLQHMLGARNCSTVTLVDMEGDRFATYSLHGRLVNIEFDLKLKTLPDSGTFKTIVAGESLSVQKKYGDRFDCKLPVRLFIGCNNFPRSADTSDGFYRRFRVLPFRQQFRPGQPGFLDAETMDTLLASESSGILVKAVAALKDLRARGQFTESQAMRNAMLKFQMSTDLLSLWLEESVEAGGRVAQTDLRAAYNRYARSRGVSEIDQYEFPARVLKYRTGVKVGDSHGVSYFHGIKRIDPPAGIYTPEQQQAFSSF